MSSDYDGYESPHPAYSDYDPYGDYDYDGPDDSYGGGVTHWSRERYFDGFGGEFSDEDEAYDSQDWNDFLEYSSK
jgi:hypothetical protein